MIEIANICYHDCQMTPKKSSTRALNSCHLRLQSNGGKLSQNESAPWTLVSMSRSTNRDPMWIRIARRSTVTVPTVHSIDLRYTASTYTSPLSNARTGFFCLQRWNRYVSLTSTRLQSYSFQFLSIPRCKPVTKSSKNFSTTPNAGSIFMN